MVTKHKRLRTSSGMVIPWAPGIPYGAVLSVAGIVSGAVYLIAAVRLPWWRFGSTLSSWSSLLGPAWASYTACLVGVGIVLAMYFVGWRAVRAASASPVISRIVWAFPVFFAATLVWLLPITSDLFTYLSQAHQTTDLGLNPFAAGAFDPSAPQQADRFLRAYPTMYSFHPSVYGPGWLLIATIATLGPYDTPWGLFFLKTLSACAFLICVWCVERIQRELYGSARSARAVRTRANIENTYLFAWNPLVLLAAVGDGHNDIVMMAFVLLSTWLLLCQRWTTALVVLAVSIWIKYVSLIFLPLYILYIWRCSPDKRNAAKSLANGAAAMAVVSVAVLAPFGPPTWMVSLAARLLAPVNWGVNGSIWATWLVGGGALAFMIAYVILVAAWLRRLPWPAHSPSDQDYAEDGSVYSGHGPLPQELLNACFTVALLAFLLGAARAQPWHLIWAACLAGLSRQRIRLFGGQVRWPWISVIGLSALLLAAQVWVEWGTPGVV